MEDFIKISQLLGKNIIHVQGAGGNASVKINNKIYIKASGYPLKKMDKQYGYTCCFYKPLVAYIKNENYKKSESQFLELLNKSIIKSESFGMPSMEAGFHAVIPSRYVFHLHNIYANIFNCMKFGSYEIKKIYKITPYTIIDYVTPGYDLASVLSKKKNLPPVIFLKNHGLIVHGESLSKCIKLVELLTKTLETYLKAKSAFVPFVVAKEYTKTKNHTFPDSAVFAKIDTNLLTKKKKKDLLEISSANKYIITVIKSLKKRPSFLNKQQINKLLAMQQEQYRQKITL